VTVRKAQHSEQWPWPVEVQHKADVVHASLASEADQRTLMDMTGRVGTKTPTTPRVSGRGRSRWYGNAGEGKLVVTVIVQIDGIRVWTELLLGVFDSHSECITINLSPSGTQV